MEVNTIILDRDGVINCLVDRYVTNINQVEFIPGSIDAINQILSAGYEVVVASNQSVVGRGFITEDDLKKINAYINSFFARDLEFFCCTHSPHNECECRKPKTGLIETIKMKYTGPYLFVGDNVTDYQAAVNADINFVLVRTGHGNKFCDLLEETVTIKDNLLELAKQISGEFFK